MVHGSDGVAFEAMRALGSEELDARVPAALELARYAVSVMRDQSARSEARWKGWADWVTTADVEIEAHVRDVLGERFPGDAVVGEELPGEAGANGQPTWYVDPIDGTTNFVYGLQSCAFSLALVDSAGVGLGVVADPWRDEVFQATRGRGAYANGIRLHCGQDKSLEGGLVLTELKGPKPWPGMTQLMERLGQLGCVTRVLGSCALSLANVAAGRASALVLGSAHAIDLAAGVLMAQEAGAAMLVGAGVEPVLALEPGVGLEAQATNPGSGPAALRPLGAGPAMVASAPGVLAALLDALRG